MLLKSFKKYNQAVEYSRAQMYYLRYSSNKNRKSGRFIFELSKFFNWKMSQNLYIKIFLQLQVFLVDVIKKKLFFSEWYEYYPSYY